MVQSHMRFRQRGSTVEQLICNQWVAGSIPVAGSTQTKGAQPMVAPFSYIGRRPKPRKDRHGPVQARIHRVHG